MRTYNERVSINKNRRRMFKENSEACKKCGEIDETIIFNIPELISQYDTLCLYCRIEEGLED